ncbi:MAG: hypothetical protein ACLQMF_20015 [Rectinemataceae bacterium]
MNRTLFVFGLLFMVLSTIFAQSQTLTFRGIPLGASPDDVVAKLGQPDEKYTKENFQEKMVGDLLFRYSKIEVAGYSARAELEFDNGKLLDAVYMFGNNFVQGNDPPYMGFLRDYVNAYADLVQKLTKLYGDPYKSNGLDGFDDESVSEFLAQKVAECAPYYSSWSFDNGGILLGFTIKNNQCNLFLSYLPKETIDKMNQANAEKANNIEGL